MGSSSFISHSRPSSSSADFSPGAGRGSRWLHLPALAWGCWVEVSHTVCPLTPLENHWRRLAGEAGYAGGFLAHYLVRVLYPAGLTPQIQWVLAALLAALNLFAYWGTLRRVRRT